MDCIEGDTIQTGTALVEEDMAQTIRGERTETNATGEPPATFDVLFRSLLPNSKENILVNLHIDFELQKEYDLGYPVIKRGIYYGCRKLSAQIDKIGKMELHINTWRKYIAFGYALKVYQKDYRILYLITKYRITRTKVFKNQISRLILPKQTL